MSVLIDVFYEMVTSIQFDPCLTLIVTSFYTLPALHIIRQSLLEHVPIPVLMESPLALIGESEHHATIVDTVIYLGV